MATLIFPEHPSPVADAEALKKACQGNPYLHDTFLFFSPFVWHVFGGKGWFFFFTSSVSKPLFLFCFEWGFFLVMIYLFSLRWLWIWVFSVLVKFFMWNHLGWGTNEKAIISVIAHRNWIQRKLIKQAYQDQYQDDLIKLFESELSGHFEVSTDKFFSWISRPWFFGSFSSIRTIISVFLFTV